MELRVLPLFPRPTASSSPSLDLPALYQQEAEDIFGNVDELLSMYEERKAQQGAHLEEAEEEEEADEEDMDEEAAEARRLARVGAAWALPGRRCCSREPPGCPACRLSLPANRTYRPRHPPPPAWCRRSGSARRQRGAYVSSWTLRPSPSTLCCPRTSRSGALCS